MASVIAKCFIQAFLLIISTFSFHFDLKADELFGCCVFRQPDRDIRKLFPQTQTYKKVYIDLSDAEISSICYRLGWSWSERKQTWTVYNIFKKGKMIGALFAHAARGENGPIEIILGVETNGKVRGLLIQREREKGGRVLRSPEWITQFKGKTYKDHFETGKDIKPVKGLEKTSQNIAKLVKLLLNVHYELYVFTSGIQE